MSAISGGMGFMEQGGGYIGKGSFFSRLLTHATKGTSGMEAPSSCFMGLWRRSPAARRWDQRHREHTGDFIQFMDNRPAVWVTDDPRVLCRLTHPLAITLDASRELASRWYAMRVQGTDTHDLHRR
jgi:hypothetical protein